MDSFVCNLCPTYLPFFETFKVSLRKLSFEGCLEEEHWLTKSFQSLWSRACNEASDNV